MESEENLIAVITAGGAENISNGWQRNIGKLLAVEPKQFQFGSGVMFVLCQQFAAGHAHALQHGVGLRDDFFPIFALGVVSVGNEDAIVRRILIGGDVEFAGKEVGAVKEILSSSDFERSVFRLEVL